jgi:hypothetical protein
VRSGEPLLDVRVDRHNGNLYAVWDDGRFSGFTHDDIAFAMSTGGGRSWTTPIKVNQTPTNIPAGDQQAFTPSVAVAANGTVGVTYYDFRNNTPAPGLLTDYWIAHADNNFTDPASWSQENRLTDASFDLELAPRTFRGFFVGDYEGLAATGNNFDALFSQAVSTSDPASIFFRDPPPAAAGPAAAKSSAEGGLSRDYLPTLDVRVFTAPVLGNGWFGQQAPRPGEEDGAGAALDAPLMAPGAPPAQSVGTRSSPGSNRGRDRFFASYGDGASDDTFADDLCAALSPVVSA